MCVIFETGFAVMYDKHNKSMKEFNWHQSHHCMVLFLDLLDVWCLVDGVNRA